MKRSIPFLLLLNACSLSSSSGDDYSIVRNISPRKQKQKIAALQKKLEIAEKEQVKVYEEVEQLRREMQLAQIQLIQRQVDEFSNDLYRYRESPDQWAKRVPRDVSTLFLQERETLHQLIQMGPSPSAFEAQVVLDQILRMITTLSDDKRL